MRVAGQARSGSSRRRSGPSLPGPAVGAGTLLNPATDLTPVGTGYFDLVDGLTLTGNGSSLAGRYISGTFRLMFLKPFNGGLNQITVPASITGQVLDYGSGGGSSYDFAGADIGMGNIDGGVSGVNVGLYWDEVKSKLWANAAVDYPDPIPATGVIAFWNLDIDAAGTVTNNVALPNNGWGFTGVGGRCLYGGIRRVPTWFQTAYGAYDYLAGFGGYTSVWERGAPACPGPFLCNFPYPNGVYSPPDFSSTTGIPSTDYKLLIDYRGAIEASACWYTNYGGGGYAARSADRGPRLTTGVTNWFDGADTRSNPSTRPTYPTDFAGVPPAAWWTADGGGAAGGTGHTPPTDGDPDGWARWTWGDTYGNNMVWIDNDAGTRTKHGILSIACLGDGYNYYKISTLNRDSILYEAHVYDPAVLAGSTGLGGATSPYAIRPTNLVNFTSQMSGVETAADSGAGRLGMHVWGVVYDPTAERLYVACYGIPNGTNATKLRIFVYQVAT